MLSGLRWRGKGVEGGLGREGDKWEGLRFTVGGGTMSFAGEERDLRLLYLYIPIDLDMN